MKRICCLLLILVAAYPLTALDTGKNPVRAALLSLAIPGGGQIYNDSPIKATFFGATEVTLAGLLIYHNNMAAHYKHKRDNTDDPAAYDRYDGYKGQQEHARYNMYWWLGTTVLMSTLDAYTEAHLFDYDNRRATIRAGFDENGPKLLFNITY